eukprot:gene27553-34288_t
MYLDGTRDISNTGASVTSKALASTSGSGAGSGFDSVVVTNNPTYKDNKDKGESQAQEPSSPTSRGSGTYRRANSSQGGGDAEDTVDQDLAEEESPPIISGASSINKTVSAATVPLTPALLNIGAPIALTVGSKGLDKLIHLTALVPKQSVPSAVSSVSGAPPPAPPVTSVVQAQASPTIANRLSFSFPTSAASVGVVNTQSAVSSETQNATTTAANGGGSVQDEAQQIGKMEEDIFAVDFYHLTPFQAFTIAIAAFDQ